MKLEYLLPLVIIPAVWLALLLVRMHLAQDRVLSFLHREHPDIWRSLGEPNGWQWSSPGRVAVPWRMWSLPARDPDWLSRTPELRADVDLIRTLRRRLRWCGLPVFAVCIIIFAIAASTLPHR